MHSIRGRRMPEVSLQRQTAIPLPDPQYMRLTGIIEGLETSIQQV